MEKRCSQRGDRSSRGFVDRVLNGTRHVTEVAFHFGAPDKVAYAARLLRTILNRSGKRTLVVAEAEKLAQLDVALWGVSPTDFVSHAGPDSSDSTAKRSAVVFTLGTPKKSKDSACAVLVNIGDVFPNDFAQFERVIEVVSTLDNDRALARERWRHYARLGYTIVRHDLELRNNVG
jgi:DNA polymerase III subunit chi